MSYLSDLKRYNKHELEPFNIRQLKSCQAAILEPINNNDVKILLSYNSLIAVYINNNIFISDYYRNYSVTTSKHITWFAHDIYYYDNIIIVDHDIIKDLYHNISNDISCALILDTIYYNQDVNNNINAAVVAAANNELLLNEINITSKDVKNRLINNLRYYNLDYNKLYEPVAYYNKELKTRFKKIEAFKLNNLYLEIISTYSNNNKLLSETIKIKKWDTLNNNLNINAGAV